MTEREHYERMVELFEALLERMDTRTVLDRHGVEHIIELLNEEIEKQESPRLAVGSVK